MIEGRLSLGDLMMFLVYLAMLLEPMAVLASSVTQLQNNLSGFDRVLDLLAEPREMADCPGTRSISKQAVSGRITLRNVGFRLSGYDPAGPARGRTSTSSRERPSHSSDAADRARRRSATWSPGSTTPPRAASRSTASTSAKSRSKATVGCWESLSKTFFSSTARSPRTSPTATAGRPALASSKRPGQPTPRNSSNA